MRRRGLALAAVSAAAALAYAPSFSVPFQFDDYARLGQNQALQHGQLVEALLWLGFPRVVPALTLVLNFQLGEFNPLGYHLLNFAVHLLATAGVFELALVLCNAPRLRQRWSDSALMVATAAAVVFACHPLQTQAVTYIIQRYASIAALFYIWAVVCYLRARSRQLGMTSGRAAPYWAATVVCSVCAVLSKENAVSLPGALLLAEWTAFRAPRRWRAIALGAGLIFAVLLVLMWKTGSEPAGLVSQIWRSGSANSAWQTQFSGGQTPPLTYLRTQALVLPRYLRLVVLPWGQNVDHDVPLAESLTPAVLAGFAFLSGLAGLGVALVRRQPMYGFAILWFFITLSVESSVIGLSDVIAEHRMYLPMAGIALAIGGLFAAAAARAPRVAPALGLAATAGLVALTFARNVVWLSPLTLWVDAAEKSPHKARPQVNAGVAYHQEERLEEAAQQYCRGLALDPTDQVAIDNLGIVLEALGEIEIEPAPDGSTTLEIADVAPYCAEKNVTGDQ